MQTDSLIQAPVEVPGEAMSGDTGEVRSSPIKRIVIIALLSLLFSSVANYALASWLGIPMNTPWTPTSAAYRRIGPESGPQVFCAGSSLLISGLSWPEVEKSLDEGIEDWTVAGSSPEVWEVFQKQKRIRDLTIVGVSVYDLNEMRLTPERANFVPLTTTIADLSASKVSSDLKRRILMQYALLYVRVLYPTAGDADKVLVGLRSKAEGLLARQSSSQEEGVVIEKNGVMGVEDGGMTLGDWSTPHVLRRLDALREDDHDAQGFFNGPKSVAFRRVLSRAHQQGRVVVVVLPVSQYYADAFLDKPSIAAFEKELSEDLAAAPEAKIVRLDQVPGISDNRHFLDLVHLNSSGRQIATPMFLREAESEAKP